MNKLKILIVDDDPSISSLIRSRLSKDAPDFAITTLNDGAECIEYLKSNKADCILSDYQMPGMDGLEMLNELVESGKDIPVIFLTGQGSEEVAREAFKAGAYDYFTKDLGFAKFPRIVNSIRQAVKQRHAEKAREKAENELVSEKSKLQSILANIGDGISIQDDELRILYQNAAHIAMIGDHAGEYCYKAYEGRETECTGCPVRAAFGDGLTHTAERCIGTSPDQSYYEIAASPLRDAKGRIVAGIEAVRDVTARKKAEMAHMESEQFLSSIFNSIRDGINVIDTDYNILRANPVVEGWLSHKTPVIGRKCYEAFHCREDVYDSCPSSQVFETGKPASDIVPLAGPDGQIKLLLDVSSFPLVDSATGRVKGAIEYSRPVLSTEGESYMSKRSLEKIIEAIKFGMVIVGRDRTIRHANQAALEMMGLDKEADIVGTVCHKNICTAEEGSCPILDLGQQVDLSEKLLLRRDGARVPILKTVTPINIEGEEMLLETFVDITAQKDAQAQAAHARSYLQSVINGSADPIMVIDRDYRVTLMNYAAHKMSRYADSELVDITCHMLSHGSVLPCSSAEGHECPLEKVVGTGKPVSVIHKHKNHGERDVWVEITASPMFDDKGEVISIIESSRDITERKEMEKQRADFYAMVTHDLKGSLTTILGYSEILSTDMADKIQPEAMEMLGGIRRSAKRLSSMVESYLTFSRLEDGKARLNLSLLEPSYLVSEVSGEFSEMTENKGMTFETRVEDGLPRLMVDSVYVQRALCNLLENALNYTPEGGSITLGAKRTEDDSGECVSLYVTDTGPGIAEGEREKIFDKYYRSPHTTGIKGSGLGLAVVKAVMEAHGGNVELESGPGGSTFSLVFRISLHQTGLPA